MDGILNTIKKLLGISVEYDCFDQELIIDINSAFSILTQLGVGPKDGYFITCITDTWTDYLNDCAKLEMVKTYVYLRVRLMFDPPSNSFLVDAINKQISELEWRIRTTVENDQ